MRVRTIRDPLHTSSAGVCRSVKQHGSFPPVRGRATRVRPCYHPRDPRQPERPRPAIRHDIRSSAGLGGRTPPSLRDRFVHNRTRFRILIAEPSSIPITGLRNMPPPRPRRPRPAQGNRPRLSARSSARRRATRSSTRRATTFETELQMTEAELLDAAPRLRRVAGRQRAVHARGDREGRAGGLKVIARAGVGYDAVDLAGRDRPRRRGVLRARHEPGGGRRARLHAHARAHPQRPRSRTPTSARASGRGGRSGPPAARRSASSASGASARRWRRARTRSASTVIADRDRSRTSGSARPTASTLVPFEELLKQSDVVTLHVPKTPLTKNLIRTRDARADEADGVS